MSKYDKNYDFKKGQLALSNIDKQKEKQQNKIEIPRRDGCSQGCLCRIKNSSLISFCPAQCKMK